VKSTFKVLLLVQLFLSVQTQAGSKNLDEVTLASKILNEKRIVSIYTPPSYDNANLRYPVIYLLDGEAYFDNSTSAVNFLSSYGLMPECIVVAIHNTNRERDLTPPGFRPTKLKNEDGKGKFLIFIETELGEYIAKNFRTKNFNLLIGHSSGGLFTLYSIYASDYFDWFISMDAPVHLNNFKVNEDLKNYFAVNSNKKGRLVLIDNKLGWQDNWNKIKNIFPAGFKLHHSIDKSETHQTMVYKSTYDALKTIFHDYSVADLTSKNFSELQKVFDRLSGKYQFQIRIPLSALVKNAEDMIFAQRKTEALELLDQAEKLYGTSESIQRLYSKAANISLKNIDETVEELVNYPLPSPDEIEKYIGTWKGQAQHKGGVPMYLTVELSKDSKGYTLFKINPNAPPDSLEHVLLRLTYNDEIEFGYMNMMRPKGVITYTGKLIGENRIEGTQSMKGVKFEIPPGMKLETVYFYLERQ
jgi:predicted alpha/beta superfamily hydrolase